MRKRLIFPILILVTSLLLSGCSLGKKEVYLITDEVQTRLFSMGDMACQQNELALYLANYKNIYGTLLGTNIWSNSSNLDELKAALKQAAFSQLTEVYALNIYAKANEIQLSESEIAQCNEAAKTYHKSLSPEEIDIIGVTVDDVYQMYLKYVLAEKTYAELIRDVDPEVSEDEARMMDAMVIYCTDGFQAKEAYQKIVEGTDFETVAANYSKLSSLTDSFGRGDYEKSIEDVVFLLDNKEYSEIINGSDGYYIFYCINKYNEELSEEKKIQIYNERKDSVLEEIYGNYQTEVTAELNKSLYDQTEVLIDETIKTDSFFTTLAEYIQYTW